MTSTTAGITFFKMINTVELLQVQVYHSL
jgi:hypothetical protein